MHPLDLSLPLLQAQSFPEATTKIRGHSSSIFVKWPMQDHPSVYKIIHSHQVTTKLALRQKTQYQNVSVPHEIHNYFFFLVQYSFNHNVSIATIHLL